jgi:integrase
VACLTRRATRPQKAHAERERNACLAYSLPDAGDKALRRLIVAGAPRAHEVFGMRRGEVKGNQWHVPAKRVKGRTDHIIPLPEEAMAILRDIEPPNSAATDFVFSGGAAGGRINHQTMRLLLRALGLDYDVHGFRTTLIGHRRILNERRSAFLTGVAYTGRFEAPGLRWS